MQDAVAGANVLASPLAGGAVAANHPHDMQRRAGSGNQSSSEQHEAHRRSEIQVNWS
jgi:hypothetical protein